MAEEEVDWEAQWSNMVENGQVEDRFVGNSEYVLFLHKLKTNLLLKVLRLLMSK